MSNIRKPKKLPYELLDHHTEPGRGLYALMARLIEQHHDDLTDARIALAWAMNWEPDVDGRVRLGAVQRASDLARELAPYDFAILLSKRFFDDPLTTREQKTAALDRELTKCAIKYDADGEPVEDSKGRKVYRVRDYDLKEFTSIVARYGANVTRDTELFAQALDRVRADSAGYVGLRSTHDRLQAAGARLTFDAVVAWSDPERREADVWARLVLELQKREFDAEIDPPAHVQAAMTVKRDSEGALGANGVM